jgi:hypothetical protein
LIRRTTNCPAACKARSIRKAPSGKSLKVAHERRQFGSRSSTSEVPALVGADPRTGARRTFAYPLDGSLYEKGRTGAAKVGDIVALGSGKVLAIEQGSRRSDGKTQNSFDAVELAPGTTDITRVQGIP